MKKTTCVLTASLCLNVVAMLVYFTPRITNHPQALHRCVLNVVTTLDPCRMTNIPEKIIATDLFEGLMIRTQTGDIKPSDSIVTNHTVSGNGLTYTFNFNPNAHWSNGDDLTAFDFAYTFKRILNPTNKSPEAFLLFSLKGAKDYYEGKSKKIIGIHTPHERRLVLTLNRPTPYFADILASSIGYPAHQKTIQTHGTKWTQPEHTVTNGPYKLVSYALNNTISLALNHQHPKSAQLKQTGFCTIRYSFNTKSNKTTDQFSIATYDVIQEFDEQHIRQFMGNENFSLEPSLGVYYYAFNMTHPKFANNHPLREALSLCIHREHIIDIALHGSKSPAYSWVPNNIGTYKPSATLTPASVANYQKAKNLYKQAGYNANQPFVAKILYTTSSMEKNIAIQISNMWQQLLGIKTEHEQVEWKTILSRRKKKEFEILAGSWIADYGDPNGFLDIFCPDAQNIPGYNNPQYAQLIKKAEHTFNPIQRHTLFQKAEAILLKDKPVIPIYHTATPTLVNKKRIQGWCNNAHGFHPSWDLTCKIN